MTRKIYASLDVAKYLMALMILFGHVSNEWAHVTGLWHYILSFDFTVPAFFAISGFLFFNKMDLLTTREEQDQYYKKWSIRVGKMYLLWSLIYLSFVIAGWCLYGVTKEIVLSSVHRWAVFSTYSTIWFLPALWVGGTIVYFLQSRLGKTATLVVVGILWLIGLVIGLYYELLPFDSIRWIRGVYMDGFFTFRNGVFYGAAYFLVGYYCLRALPSFKLLGSAALFVVSYFLFFIEAVLMHQVATAPDTDMAAFMLPSVFFLVIAIAKVELPQKLFYTSLRNQSMLIFCGQRLFLTAIPGLMPMLFAPVKEWASLPIMLFFCIPVIIFAFVVDRINDRKIAH